MHENMDQNSIKTPDQQDEPGFECFHDHVFLSEHHRSNEKSTWMVILLAFFTMIAEIISGWIFGSMALLADGWHMASHVSALFITAIAYYFARKHRHNPGFTFGTGKIGDLSGYSSALLLLLIALLMAYESIARILSPVPIRFNEAIFVAFIGLFVNLASAFLLKEGHHHGHDHEKDRCGHERDHNLHSAYLHVLADALTSVLAILALFAGKYFGLYVMDPVMGVVGALVITRWSFCLLRDSGRVLLDYQSNDDMEKQIVSILSSSRPSAQIQDLHVWRLGPGHISALIALTDKNPLPPAAYKAELLHIPTLSHITIEVNPETGSPGA